jgi:hypothetical protein
MMADSIPSPDEGLAGVLAARARAASDGRLILDVAVGLLVVLALAIWHPHGWIVPLNMGLTLAAFGAWGIADREITERALSGSRRFLRAFRALRGFAVVAGVLSATVACFALLGVALGEWKS